MISRISSATLWSRSATWKAVKLCNVVQVTQKRLSEGSLHLLASFALVAVALRGVASSCDHCHRSRI